MPKRKRKLAVMEEATRPLPKIEVTNFEPMPEELPYYTKKLKPLPKRRRFEGPGE